MENDEKRKKVIDELERRKEIIEALKESIRMSSERFVGYAFMYCIRRNSLIDDALCFVRDDMVKYGKLNYSDSKSFAKSVEKNWRDIDMRNSVLTAYNSKSKVIAYIGKVIDDMNDNYYPKEYEVFIRFLDD
jgi:hypothetical protein